MSDLTLKGIKAFVWDFGGKLSTQGVSFGVTIILARLLEPSDFGLIAMIMVVVGVAQVFADVGLGAALIQRRRLLPIHYYSVFYLNMAIAIFLMSLIYSCAGYVANFYGNEKLKLLTQVISILFVFSAFSNVQGILLRKQLRHKVLAKANVLSAISSGVVGILLAIYGAGVWSLVAQIIAQAFFYNVLLWSVTDWLPRLEFSFKALKQLWLFGFKMFVSASLLEAIFVRIDFLIIGKLFSESTLGFFQRAKQFNVLMVQLASGSLMSVLFPLLSQVQKDLPRLRNITLKSLNIVCFLIFLLLGGLYLTSDELIIFLFSEKWLPSAAYLKILLLSGFGYPISALLVNVLGSRGNANAFLKLEIIKKSMHTVNFVNAIYNGVEMYLYGLIVVVVLSLAMNVYFVNKEINVGLKSLVRPILTQMGIGLFAVFCTLGLAEQLTSSLLLGFFVKGSLFSLLFLSANFLMKTKSYFHVKELLFILLNRSLRSS